MQSPLSIPASQETPGYMEMRSSVQSLNILPEATLKRGQHHPLTRSDRPLGQLSMSPSTMSRSFDAVGQTPRSNVRSKIGSQSSTVSVMSPCE